MMTARANLAPSGLPTGRQPATSWPARQLVEDLANALLAAGAVTIVEVAASHVRALVRGPGDVVHDVNRHLDAWACSCAGHRWRTRRRARACGHVTAVRQILDHIPPGPHPPIPRRESVPAKATRLLASRRVHLIAADNDHVRAVVLGDTGLPRQVTRDPDGWACSCPAYGPRCSHIAAVRRVTTATIPRQALGEGLPRDARGRGGPV